MKLFWLVAVVAGLTGIAANAATSQWEQPAAALADQIADILGPGQARLTIRNLSTVPTGEIPAIRELLKQDLKTHGVLASGEESANSIRVTLSENLRERLWVAEVIEGTETRVAMVNIQHSQNQAPVGSAPMLLLKEQLFGPNVLDSLPCFSTADGKPPLLFVAERRHGLLALKEGCLLALDRSPSGFFDGRTFDILAATQAATRDPRGLISTDAEGDEFRVSLPGTECAGSYAISSGPNRPPDEGWLLHCHPSDDPWPILTAETPNGRIQFKAFFNSARNYFTGVVTPSVGVNLPAFYSAALVPRATGPALLIIGIDGKVELAENGSLRPVSGTRDWGSDFAALNSGCGAGTQIVASGSGEALSDSLRAYEMPGQEAVPATAPLTMDGTVTALWTAPDGKSIYAVVRRTANPSSSDEYEVDRVTASCN